MGRRAELAGISDLEQRRNRVGGAGRNLIESRGRQIKRRQTIRRTVPRIDECARSGPNLGSRTRIDHSHQRGRRAAAGGVGKLARDIQVTLGRPQIDEDVHDAAAGADFALIEVAGKVDLGQPRRALFFK